MEIDLTKEQIIELGIRNKAGALLEQAGYTLGLARLDGEPLVELLDPGCLDEVAVTVDQVRESLKDRAIAAEESKGSTQALNEAMREAKLWRRRVNDRAERAAQVGKKIPDGLRYTEGVKGVPGVAVQLDKMVGLLEANFDLLHKAGLKALIKEGQDLADKLKAVDVKHELKRAKDLPDKVREFYYRKGLLLMGIKVINHAGRELHYREPAKVVKYDLAILHRHVNKKKAAPPATA